MSELHDEKIRLQAEIQAAEAEITNLTTQLQAQQQAIGAAQSRVSAAQSRLTGAQAQLPPLEAAAAAADRRVVELNQDIDAHLAVEPEKTIGLEHPPRQAQNIPGELLPAAPRPNPAWAVWKRALDRLTQQLEQAQADAAANHVRLDGGRAQVSQATAEVQAAERQVADATGALQVTQRAIAAARQRQETARNEVANLDRWNDEIARDPLARTALEQAAAELSDRAAVLEDARDTARVQNEIAQETHASMSARRDQLTPALNQVNAQLPAASEELRAANELLAAASSRIQRHRQQGPRR
jgi:chromosome segregation ATPase